MTHGDWKETYAGGSVQAERAMIEGYARDMRAIQRKIALKTGKAGNRTLHAKIIAGFQNARIEIDPALPDDLRAGYFRAGERFPVTIRFSNASPICAGDAFKDMRGVALRIHVGENDYHDLLMTSFPVSHARDAQQFVDIARIATGPKALLLPRLIAKLGWAETKRVIKNITAATQPCESLVTLQCWSRAPLLWGDGGPVRYTLRPKEQPQSTAPDANDPDYLETELAAHLDQHDVTYRLSIQRYVDARTTPIEDGAAQWHEADAPYVDLARVVIPRQRLLSDEGARMKAAVDHLAFNPWNCPEPFRPLGSLNRARGRVYAASAEGWLGSPPPKPHHR